MLANNQTNNTKNISEEKFKEKPFSEKWQLYNNLLSENQHLKTEFLKIALMNGTLSVENFDLKNKNEDLYKNLHNQNLLKEQTDFLVKENAELKEKINKQNVKISELEIKVKEQDVKMTALEKDVKKLKERNIPITIREAICVLEIRMMTEIVGSKRQANRYHGIYDLSRENNYKTIYNQYLQNNNITQDHIDLMLEFKKNGNKSAHTNRPTYNKNEWKIMLLDCLDYPQNQQDINMLDDIILLMEKYNPSGNPWIMKKP